MALILVVDDEPGIREMLVAALSADGHRALGAPSAAAGLETLGREAFDLLITDLAMPVMDGVELLRRTAAVQPDLPSIVITAFGSKESAIEAMRHGAVNYVEKPFDVEEMLLHVRRALGTARLSAENRRLRAQILARKELIGDSPAIGGVRALIERVADADTTVLITGESGTGKEVVARTIHRSSPRAERPFVGINCAAIPGDLLESELFGHIRGAFTGADRSRPGLIEAAEGGTLFLDEIGDMSPNMQAKLLRVLQERRIRRVGGSEEIPVDVRLLAATHRDLPALVREGGFREDLFYRIHVVAITVPPLRERKTDLPRFVSQFVEMHARRMGRRIVEIAPDFLEALGRYDWPGNVRELENVIERAVALCTDEVLRAALLPPEIVEGTEAVIRGHGVLPERFDLERYLDGERRHYMLAALAAAGGVQTRAAERLGMTFRSFRYFAKKFELARGEEVENAAEPVAASD